jgi:hypothetical protein
MTELTYDVYNHRKINLQHQLTAAKTNLAELALVAERGGKADTKTAKDIIASFEDRLENLDLAWGQERAEALLALRAADVVGIEHGLAIVAGHLGSFAANNGAAMDAIRSLLGDASDARVIETKLDDQHIEAWTLGYLTRAGMRRLDDFDAIGMARAFEGRSLVEHDTSRMNQMISMAARTVPGLRTPKEN